MTRVRDPGLSRSARRLVEDTTADVEARVEALEDWAERDPAGVEKVALRLTRDPSEAIRESAFAALAGARSDRALQTMLDALDTIDSTGAAVLNSLARTPHPRATDRLLAELRQAVNTWRPDRPPGMTEDEFHRRMMRTLWLPGILGSRPDGDRALSLLADLSENPLQGGWWADQLRGKAIEALGKMRAVSAKAVPILAGLLRGRRGDIHRAALRALGAIGPTAATALPQVIVLFKETKRDSYLRNLALETIGHLGAGDPSLALPVLIPALGRHKGGISTLAAMALRQMGPAARPALRPLVRLAMRGPRLGAWRAVDALPAIDPTGTAVIWPLIGLLNSPWKDVCQKVVMVLGEYGPAAATAVPALRKLLTDRSLAEEVIRTLAKMARAALPSLPALVKALRGGRLSYTLFSVFHDIDPVGTQAIPALVALLKDKKKSVRHGALYGLYFYQGQAGAALPAVSKLMADRSPEVRNQAKETLAMLGPGR
jgi:HEAT repeat protein